MENKMKAINDVKLSNKLQKPLKTGKNAIKAMEEDIFNYDKKLKVLAFSDIHGDKTLLNKMVEKADNENVDVVLICGDISTFGKNYENMIGPFLKKGKKVLFIPGNHEGDDLAEFLAEVYKIKNLHGYHAVYNGVGFFGCGGANIGPNIKTESEIMEAFNTGFDKVKHLKKKIMVSHMHPEGSKMESFSNFVPGSSSVTEAIKKFRPDILVCGHVHEGTGIEEIIGETKVINVAKMGKVFEI